MKTIEQKAKECLANLQAYTGGWEQTFVEGYMHGHNEAVLKLSSVHDKMPELGKGVLIRLDNNQCSCPWALGYLEEEKGWLTWRDFDDNEIDSDFVVAWMYLSTIPKSILDE